METIYYTSDIKWFNHAGGKYESKHHALKAHVEYALNSKDCKLYDGDKNRILERAKIADKRVNSNIAFSFNTALPNNLTNEQVKQWIEDIKDILSALLDMDKNDILVAFHDSKGISQMGNKHLHIIGLNLKSDGKALTINKNTLRSLHQALQQLIIKRGYTIRRDEQPIGHLGPRLHYDDELRQDYIVMVEAKQIYRETLQEIQTKKKQEEEKRKQEEIQKKKDELLRGLNKNWEDITKSYSSFEKVLKDNIKQRFNQFFTLHNHTVNIVKNASSHDELRDTITNYNGEVKKIFDLIAIINKEIERKRQAKQQATQEQKPTEPQKPAPLPKQPAQQQEIKSQPKTETKPAQPIQPKLQEPIQKTAQPKFQEQKPTIEPAQQPPKQSKQEQKPVAPEPRPTIKIAQTQPQAQKPSTELPKQAMSKPQPTQPQKQQPIQKSEPKQEQKPTQKPEAQKSEPKPQPKREKPKTEEVKTQQIETPKIESEPKPVESEKIETPPQSEIKPEQTIETKSAETETTTKQQITQTEEQPRKHRYILLYEDEKDADWYWENYIVNNIDENTNVETYPLPERLTEDHMNRLKRIASKGHRIDLLISNEQYFYVNYDVLDKLKDYINIMVIEKPEQGQRQKNQDREEQEQDRGYHRPMM